MASAHIEIGTQTRLSNQLRAILNQTQNVVDQAENFKAIIDQIALGGDWEALGAALGVSAADAQIIYNLFGSAEGELRGPFLTQLLSRLG